MAPLSHFSPKPPLEVRFSTDTPIIIEDNIEEEEEVTQITIHTISQYQEPLERNVITFEASNELFDDVKHLASQKFIIDGTFVKTSKFKTYVYEYKGKIIREKLKDISPKREIDALKEL